MNTNINKKRPASAASAPRTPAAKATRQKVATTVATTTPSAPSTPRPPLRPLPWTRASLTAAAQSLASSDPRLAALIEEHGIPFEKLLPKTTATEKVKEEEETETPSPPPQETPHHFSTLARAIVGQQVSGAAAATIYKRVLSVCCGGMDAMEEMKEKKNRGKGGCVVAASERRLLLTPEALLAASLELLRAAGLSERKASYLIGLAEKFAGTEQGGGRPPLPLDQRLDALASSGDAAAVEAELVSVRGVGAWTAHMHLIFHCGSPDVLPVGDLGIKKGFAKLFGSGIRAGGGGGGGDGGGSGGGNGGGSGNGEETKTKKAKTSPANLPSEVRMTEMAEPFRPHRSLLSYYLWRAAG